MPVGVWGATCFINCAAPPSPHPTKSSMAFRGGGKIWAGFPIKKSSLCGKNGKRLAQDSQESSRFTIIYIYMAIIREIESSKQH